MFITGTGMVCPVGLSAVSACAAKRAGISALANLPYRDNAGEPRRWRGVWVGLDVATRVSPTSVTNQGANGSSKRSIGCVLGPGAAACMSCRARTARWGCRLGFIDRGARRERTERSVSSEELARLLFATPEGSKRCARRGIFSTTAVFRRAWYAVSTRSSTLLRFFGWTGTTA